MGKHLVLYYSFCLFHFVLMSLYMVWGKGHRALTLKSSFGTGKVP